MAFECVASVPPTLVAAVRSAIRSEAPNASNAAVSILLKRAMERALPPDRIPEGQYPSQLQLVDGQTVSFRLVDEVPEDRDRMDWPESVSCLFER